MEERPALDSWKTYEKACRNYEEQRNVMQAWFRHHYAFYDRLYMEHANKLDNGMDSLGATGGAEYTSSLDEYFTPRVVLCARNKETGARCKIIPCSVYDSYQENGLSEEEDEEVEEVDEEWMKFMLESEVHRENRSTTNTTEKETSNLETQVNWLACDFDEFLQIDQVTVYSKPCTDDDFQSPPEDGLAKHRVLYGSAAQEVYNAEEQLQSDFDAQLDRYNPPLWPAIPLRI